MSSAYIKRIGYIISIVISVITLSGMLDAAVVYASSLESKSYTLHNPRIIPSGGEASSKSYILKEVAIGSVFGGTSESKSYKLHAAFFTKASFNMFPLDWLLDGIKPGEYRITNNDQKIIVENKGDAKITYRLYVIDPTGRWNPSCATGVNQYTLKAIFTGLEVPEVKEADFGEEDVVLGDFKESTDARFASVVSSKNGSRVFPNGRRALWLMWTAPKADTTDKKQQNLWLIVDVKEVN